MVKRSGFAVKVHHVYLYAVDVDNGVVRAVLALGHDVGNDGFCWVASAREVFQAVSAASTAAGSSPYNAGQSADICLT